MFTLTINKYSMSNILHLTLKKKYFDMIASGVKKEEYREVKPYWISRLVHVFGAPHSCEDFNFMYMGFKSSMEESIFYEAVRFKNGYNKNAPEMDIEVKNIDINIGKEEWGAEYAKPYFVISLGKILSIKNYKQIQK
jgi:hypothetical protein